MIVSYGFWRQIHFLLYQNADHDEWPTSRVNQIVTMPLPNYPPCMEATDTSNTDELIQNYFNQGYTNLEIIEFLSLHDVTLSLSTLKRRLQDLQLRRRSSSHVHVVSADELKLAIQEELVGSGCVVGYRKMWKRLKSQGLIVKRSRVMQCLRELDPEGVNDRTKKRLRRRAYHSKGPNFTWHIDGHDKLKPFGFSIHACIDGFSRRLIWLEVCATNKNPDVIGKYYLDAIKQVGGAPRKMRSDDGTENSLVEALHIYFRFTHDDDHAGFASFAIGTSTSNQRIEAFWSHLIRDGPGWWRNFFKDLRDFDLFNDSDPVQVECLRFCFMSILRKELHKVAESWNQHIISRSKFGNSSGPRGRPDCMYFLPHLYDVEDCKVDIDLDEIEEFYDDAAMNVRDYSEEFEEYALTVMNRRALSAPIDVKQAFNLYIELLREIELAS